MCPDELPVGHPRSGISLSLSPALRPQTEWLYTEPSLGRRVLLIFRMDVLNFIQAHILKHQGEQYGTREHIVSLSDQTSSLYLRDTGPLGR